MPSPGGSTPVILVHLLTHAPQVLAAELNGLGVLTEARSTAKGDRERIAHQRAVAQPRGLPLGLVHQMIHGDPRKRWVPARGRPHLGQPLIIAQGGELTLHPPCDDRKQPVLDAPVPDRVMIVMGVIMAHGDSHHHHTTARPLVP